MSVINSLLPPINHFQNMMANNNKNKNTCHKTPKAPFPQLTFLLSPAERSEKLAKNKESC